MIAVIGDVHGQYDALRRLERRLPRDAERVFVGDLFDRGPKSREVYEFLHDLPHRRVRGNHDQQLIDVLNRREGDMTLEGWLYDNGGKATVSSFQGKFPTDLAEFLDAVPLYVEVDGLLVVHAGIRPMVSLSRQDPFDLLWIREEFYDAPDHGYPGTVVFGHTAFERVWFGRQRVGCDTGAGQDHQLSAVLFEDGVSRRVVSEAI